jgi:mannose-1-phosphate guanylyltransferase
MYVVILAGGGGTRLWPLSSPERPKPFLPLVGDQSLLQLTVERIRDVVRPDDVVVVTDRRYAGLVRMQQPDVRVLSEPVGRNTAAAVALAVAAIDRPEEEVMAVLPSDHWIADEAGFREILRSAAALAEHAFDIEEPLVTLGVQPTGPSTHFGYLLPDLDAGANVHGVRAYPLRGFEEKPTEGRARELFGISGTAWNAGMFLWRRRSIRAALERYTSLLTLLGPAVGSDLALQSAYDHLAPLSVDRAVMEGAAQDSRVVMAAMDVGWSDLGDWNALLQALGTHGTGRVVSPGETIELGDDDLLVERRDGQLALVDGPREGLASALPTALLSRTAADRPRIDALLERVAAQEVTL